jgi:hypothetical protein
VEVGETAEAAGYDQQQLHQEESRMARTIEVPSPEPDDPIFSEGFTTSSARISKGRAAAPESDADQEESAEGKKSEGLDSAG